MATKCPKCEFDNIADAIFCKECATRLVKNDQDSSKKTHGPSVDGRIPELRLRPRALRVFVSSTFRGMQEEREELAKRVFPRLRKLCEERLVMWSEVDLRWGIETSDETKAEEKVLRTCLDEVERCRPFFIGMLGDRYGSVLESDSAGLIEREPWIADCKGCSVTELEIMKGVFANPEMAEHAFFYLRDPSYIDSLSPEMRKDFVEGPTAEEVRKYGEEKALHRAEERKKNLEALKQRILNSGCPAELYKDPKALGHLVLRDFTKLIDQLYPKELIPGGMERQAVEHEFFARSRLGVYIGRKEYFERLDTHTQEEGSPLVILGESGSGKSALLANWALKYREDHPDEFVLMHFLGASTQSADWVTMLHRIMSEFKKRFSIQRDISEKPDELRAAFANWLHLAADKGRVILIIDGLDQLEDRDYAPDLAWLPHEIPPKIRLLLSTLPGRPLDELQTRRWPSITIEVLDRQERRRLVREYLAQYAKELSKKDEDSLVGPEQTSNPLYLRELLEELRIYGDYLTLDVEISKYLAAKTIEQLCDLILQRYERDYEIDRPGLVGDAMSLLWAARLGLSEAELRAMLGSADDPLPAADWSPLYSAGERMMLRTSGLINFSHDHLRRAVQKKYLPSEKEQQAVRLRIADYFERREFSGRKVDELLWQLYRASAFKQLAAALGDLDLLRAAVWRNRYEVFNYFRSVESHEGLKRSYVLGKVIERPADYLDYVEIVCLLLANGGLHAAALNMLKAAEEHCRQIQQSKKLAKFLSCEFHIREDELRINPEGKKAKTPTGPLEEIVSMMHDIGKTRDTISALELISSIELARKNTSRGLALLRQSEKVARDTGHSYDRIRLLSEQAQVYWAQGDVQAALCLHTLAFASATKEDNRDALSDLCLQAGIFSLALGFENADQYFANSIRFLREIATLEEVASRMRTVAYHYLKLGVDQYQSKRRSYFLRNEARRLYAILGSTQATPSHQEILADNIIFKEFQHKSPSPEDLLADRIVWPLPSLRWGSDVPGKRCTWWMVSRETIESCSRSVRSCAAALALGESVMEKFDVGYAWDAILYQSSSFRRAQPSQRPAGPEQKDAPYHLALFGNWEVNDDFDVGTGPYQYLAENEVGTILKWLEVAAGHPDLFSDNYDGRAMDNLDVYPGGWEEMEASGRNYVRGHLDRLIAFYKRALDRKAAIICGIWGPECDRNSRRFVRSKVVEPTARQRSTEHPPPPEAEGLSPVSKRPRGDRHHPRDCPSSNAKDWRSAMRGEQGPMAEDRASEIDLDTYKFCPGCDPGFPLKY